MKKPWQIGLLSLVPGLGFLALGEVRQGLTILAGFILLMVFYLFAPWRTVHELSCGLALTVWLAQIYLAIARTRRQARLDAGLAQAARPTLPTAPAPSGASRAEKVLHNAREAIAQQLLPDEHLNIAITCQAMPTLGSHLLMGAAAFATMRVFHIGLTEQDLVMLQLDAWGKPAEVRRLRRSGVKVIKLHEGLINDTLTLDVGEKRPLRLQVSRLLRSGTRQLLESLTS